MKEEKRFAIVMCKCCLIAEAMKTCSTCRFKIGLLEQVTQIEPVSIPIMIQPSLYEMAE